MNNIIQSNGKAGAALSRLVFSSLAILLPFGALANNATVSEVGLSESIEPKTTTVKFNISWDNSWRNIVNYDAVWVFVKYSKDDGATWGHATMKTAGTNPAGFSVEAGTNLDIIVPADKKGAFLRRHSEGKGRVAAQEVRLVWDFETDGLTVTNAVKVKVHAVEMIYVPQGSFYAGSGGSGSNEFTLTQITTADASAVGGYPSGQTAANASWPNGYSAFYAMKTEIQQGLYLDFLNSLTAAQAANRCSASSVGDFMGNAAGITVSTNRNGIQLTNDVSAGHGYACNLDGDEYFNEGEDGKAVACNWLNWADLAAFADWSALRPMTELEYEKLCRGPSTAVSNEYPWGVSYGLRAARGIVNSGCNNEVATNASNYANCSATNHSLVQGPMRCGAFASDVTKTTRMQSGAGYYGNMELGGNVLEQCVSIANATGQAYAGVNGNGVLTAGGDADPAGWPGADAVGAGARGGSWQDNATLLMTSDRQNALSIDATRNATYGGRCVRTAE